VNTCTDGQRPKHRNIRKEKKVLADGNVAVVYILNSLKFKLEYNGTEGKIWLGLPMCSW
jgi:hypothetical protein